MLDFSKKDLQFIERSTDKTFEPAHIDYYRGPAGKSLRLVSQARRDLLSIWRKKDYTSKLAQMKILGRQVTLINDPDLIRDVLVKRQKNYERKSPQMRRALEKLLGDGLFISDGETWQNRRALVSDIVHRNRVASFGKIMQETTVELTHRWAEQPQGTTLNALHEMAGLTAEIISRSIFGRDLGKQSANDVADSFTNYQSLVDSINLGYFIGFDEGLPIWRKPSMKKSIARIHGIIDQVVEDHLAGKGSHNSMVDLLIRRQQRNPELKIDLISLRNEAATIFMAGHETTAATLTWAWYLLAKAPWIEKKLVDEITRVCGDRTPSFEDVEKLEWCSAVIDETLRLYPPVPLLARQTSEADEIDGHKIEKSSLLIVAPWLLHRNGNLHRLPHRFDPSRFMNGKKPEPYSYMPFASGPRICPGMHFGLVEAILCLAILLQKFKVTLLPDYTARPVCRLTLRPHDGLPIQIQPRKPASNG